MGWKISSKLRNYLLEQADAHTTIEGVSDYIIIDLNTQVRLVTAGNVPTSAMQAAGRVIDRAFGKGCEQSSGVIIVADDKTKLPPIRAKVTRARLNILTPEQQREAAARGKVVVGDRAFVRGTEPYSDDELEGIRRQGVCHKLQWERLLNSSRGKALAFELIVSAIKHNAQSVVRASTFKLLLWHVGETPYLFPNNVWPPALVKSITDNAFGEADERVTEAIVALQTFYDATNLDIVVKTIDTDMLIQVLVADIIPKGSLKIQFKNECVDALKWIKFYGRSVNERASKALLLTFASGCDYNSGITPYGYLNASILEQANASIFEPFVTIDRSADTCVVDVCKLASSVKQIPRRNKRKIPHEFKSELENAAFTVAYFSGIKRLKGGPDVQTLDAFENQDANESEFEAFIGMASKSKSDVLISF